MYTPKSCTRQITCTKRVYTCLFYRALKVAIASPERAIILHFLHMHPFTHTPSHILFPSHLARALQTFLQIVFRMVRVLRGAAEHLCTMADGKIIQLYCFMRTGCIVPPVRAVLLLNSMW